MSAKTVIKSEPHEPQVGVTSDENINGSELANAVAGTKKSMPTVVVYVNPGASCGPHISPKFHRAHTKFGPGSAKAVYKSIVQSLLDDALNQYEVVNMIPSGQSSDCVRCKFMLSIQEIETFSFFLFIN